MPENESKKLIDLDLLGVAMEEIEKKYATKDEVATGIPGVTLATEEEIRALFNKNPAAPIEPEENPGDDEQEGGGE